MRNIYILAVIAFSLNACGGGEKEATTVAEKEAKIIALKKQVAELNTKIGALQADIDAAKGASPEDNLRKVEVLDLKPATFEHFVEVQGNVSSDKDVNVFPKASGIILKRLVEEGQSVQQGQAIAEIDTEQIRKAIQELETRLDLAKTMFERQAKLWEQKIGSEMQYLQAKNNKEALEKSLDAQRTMIANGTVRAPISGVLDQFFMKEGEMGAPTMPIAKIVNTATVEIKAEVSETYTKNVKRGDEVQVSFPAIDVQMPVRIDQIGQTINPKNRTFSISMKAPNSQGYLKPNAMAVVKIKDFSQANAIAVPSHVIQQSTNGQRFLYVVREAEGKTAVAKVVVEPGLSYEGNTLIINGLQAGDKLIVKGFNEVIDGEPVQALPLAEQTAAL